MCLNISLYIYLTFFNFKQFYRHYELIKLYIDIDMEYTILNVRDTNIK